MRLSHSISMTLFVSALASLSACSSEEPGDGGDGGGATGGTGVSGTGGSGGTAGSGVSGSGGAGMSGAAGAGTSGSGGGGVLDHPDSTQAGIEAYLMMESYKGAGWRPEALPGNDLATPHLAANRYFNETIIASKAAGNKPPTMGQHLAGSMTVKEILEGTAVIGRSAMLRSDTNQWVYYCVSSVGVRCGPNVADNTAYYSTTAGPCSCHGSGNNTSHDAIPAP